MSATQKYRHVTSHNSRWVFQLSILGRALRTNQHYETEEDAALACDLVKHYLRTEFKLSLPESLDGEQFSSLAYSRRGVNLSDCLSVFKSMPEDVRDFIEKHLVALAEHRDNAPPESTASKFRRSGMINTPAVREWVERLEVAESEAIAFDDLDSDMFFLRLKVVASSLTSAIKSLRITLKMHANVVNPRLVDRHSKMDALVLHLEQNLDYVTELTANLRAEQSSVETAVANLEANRPSLL